MKKWLQKWLGVSTLQTDINDIHDNQAEYKQHVSERLHTGEERLKRRMDELDKLTTIDVDVGVRGPCTVILSGVYRGKGYVQFYEMDHDEFRYTVEGYRTGERRGTLRNIDTIPSYRGGAFEL